MILPSSKNSIYYIEHCKIVMADEHLSFIKQNKGIEKYFAIPYANTSCILAGPGTSISQSAAIHLAEENVMFAFTGGGGYPIYMASLNEYRPTEYMQKWVGFWFNEEKRLQAAKMMHLMRCEYTLERFKKIYKDFPDEIIQKYKNGILLSNKVESLLGYEANFAKSIYAFFAYKSNIQFTRNKDGQDEVNKLVTQGNYLCYGISSSVLWVLGISPSFALTHGATRRGALVFDLADIIKPSVVLLNVAESIEKKLTQQQFRSLIIQDFDENKIFQLLAQKILKIIDEII